MGRGRGVRDGRDRFKKHHDRLPDWLCLTLV